MRYEVLICGYFGFGNLGDEMILRSSIEALLSSGISKDQICVMTNDPALTRAEHGVDCIDRWSLSSLIRTARSSRMLLLPGGGLFQDSTSVRSCVYYWGVIRIASLLGCRIIALGQSVGPLTRKSSSAAACSALRRADTLYVRDDASLKLLESMGIACQQMPDTVLGCDIKRAESGQDGSILLNLRPSDKLDQYLSMVCDLIKAISANRGSVVFVAMSPEDERLADIFSSVSGIEIESVAIPRSIQDIFRLANGASCALGMRLHFVELMHASGMPTVAISYDPKVSSFARANDIPDLTEQSVINIISALDKYTMKSEDEKLYDLARIEDERKRVRDIFRSVVYAS